jgi:hypothetical protein
MPNTRAVADRQTLINKKVTPILLFLQANIKKNARDAAPSLRPYMQWSLSVSRALDIEANHRKASSREN